MIKYSIVIPTYQSTKVLFRTMEALVNQEGVDRENFEILLVDDKCNENIRNYIESMDSKCSLRYLYMNEGLKLCRNRARNFGWKAAQGEIVVFVDFDILVDQNYFAELERCYQLDNSIIVVGTCLYQPEGYTLDDNEYMEQIRSKVTAKRTECIEDRHITLEALSYNVSVHRFPWLLVSGCNLAVPKKLLENSGGFEEEERESGIALGYRLYSEGARIIVNHKMEAVHQYHEIEDEDFKVGTVNIEWFLSKYSGAFGDIPQGKELEIFHPKVLLQNKVLRNDSKNPLNIFKKKFISNTSREIINFRNKAEFERIKGYITTQSAKKNVEIVIVDYVEDTDLDLWMQLTNFEGMPPLYYPVSKRIVADFSVPVHDFMNKAKVADEKGKGGPLPISLADVRIKRINLLVTKYCNLRCRMCDYSKYSAISREFTLEEIKNLITDSRDLGLMQLELSGGEPMMRPDIYEIISFTRSLGVNSIIMMTNGVLIGQEEANRLVSSGLTEAVISLEGFEELNDSIRGKGNFKKALNAIKCLKEAGMPNVKVGFTITKHNYMQLVSLTQYLFDEVGIGSISYNPFTSKMLLTETFKERKDEFVITKELIDDVKHELNRVIEEAALKGWRIPLEKYLRKIPDYFEGKPMIPFNGCTQPLNGCCIDSSGSVYGCWGEPVFSGNIRSESLKNIVASKTYQYFCWIAKKGKCNGCLTACYEQAHK